jgi:hypothetical protein
MLDCCRMNEATRVLVAAMMEHFLGERQKGEQANYLNDFLYEPAHISSPLGVVCLKL